MPGIQYDDFSLAEFYDFDAWNLHDSHPRPLRWTLTHFTGPEHVRWRPGSRTSYSNPGYGLAGRHCRENGGCAARRLHRGEHYASARDGAFGHARLTPAVKDALAKGYHDEEPLPYFPIFLRPAGEMKSSATEMATGS